MNCKKCGNPVTDGMLSCPVCGESVNAQQPNATAYNGQPVIQVIAPEPKKKPFYKKWWFILGIVIVVIIIIASAGSGDSDIKKDDETVASTAAGEEADNVFSVGEVCNYSGLKIKFVSAEVWTGYSQYSAPEEGNIVVRYYFEIENTDDSDRSVSYYDFEAYADGKATVQRYFEDDLSLSLSAGRSGSGYVYFEVPEDVKRVECEYEYDWLSDSKVIFLFEPEE